ncbi:MAG: hypothetical protein H6726_29455 [Sandaracinaceae bacterium]|nr:hypothetical protein [Sandaracinaceae bacterium]
MRPVVRARNPRTAPSFVGRLVVLASALVVALSLTPQRAAADLGTIEVHTGVLRLERHGDARYRPVVRGAFGVQVAGPLHMGGFVQLTGYELPLRSAQPGGGLFLSVRPRIPLMRVRPSLDASFARLRLPLDQLDGQPRPEAARTFAVSVAGNLGVAVADAVTLELRVEYAHYLGDDPTAGLGSGSIAGLFGMVIHIP